MAPCVSVATARAAKASAASINNAGKNERASPALRFMNRGLQPWMTQFLTPYPTTKHKNDESHHDPITLFPPLQLKRKML